MQKVDLKIKEPNFIGSWNLENNDLCKEIINFFEANKGLHKQGVTGSGKDISKKNTIDISITPNNLKELRYKCFNTYIAELYKCYNDYKDQWPFLKSFIKDVHMGSFNVQKYYPGESFVTAHTERDSIYTTHRVFAWMTYLNDVEDGGTTNFSHYGVKIKPEIGKTLIWPAEWTHAHSGEIINSGVKYIITGWMHFPYDNDGEK